MESAAPPVNEVLAEALRARRPRFFRAGRDSATGRTGPEDTARFADNLMVLQECALLLGEKLGVGELVHAVLYEGEEMIGFGFDPGSNPQSPEVVGAIVNRRLPMREFSRSLRESIEP